LSSKKTKKAGEGRGVPVVIVYLNLNHSGYLRWGNHRKGEREMNENPSGTELSPHLIINLIRVERIVNKQNKKAGGG
jgi:hypothetical protein